MTQVDDRDLVLAVRAGDREAAEELALRYRDVAFTLAVQLLRNRDIAMDVAQDALIKFFTKLDRFDASRPVKPWLARIIHNQVRDHYRRAKVRRAESLDDDESHLVEPTDPNPSPEQMASQAQLRQRVWKALESLDESSRNILVLRDYQDLSYKEIADVLGTPIGTVMSRLHRARKRLATALEADGGGRIRR